MASNSIANNGEIDESAELLQCINNMCEKNEFADVTFIVEDTRIPAHKNILSARSSYFNSMFGGGLVGSKQDEIRLTVPLNAFKAILKYIYTGRLSLAAFELNEIFQVYDLANQFKFDSVKKIGLEYLTENLTFENSVAILNAAQLYSWDNLQISCLTLMDTKSIELLDHESFNNLALGSLCALLRRDSFYAREMNIFNAICNWYKGNPNADIKEALSTLRWSKLNSHELISVLFRSNILERSELLKLMEENLDKSDRIPSMQSTILTMDPAFGAAVANPTITAALTQKTTTSPAMSPSFQEQKLIFGGLLKPATSKLMLLPGSKLATDLATDIPKSDTPIDDATRPNSFTAPSFDSQPENQKPKKLTKTETALSWFGQDFSENELQTEMLAIRFKTAEACNQFHDTILAAQAKMTDDKSEATDAIALKANEKQANTPADKPADKPKSEAGLGDKFKPKVGSWTCDACYVTNQEAVKKYLPCGSPKDKTAPPEENTKAVPSASKCSFDNLSSLNSSKPAENNLSSNANAPTFNFGNLNTSQNALSTTTTSTTESKSSFGSSTFNFSFGSQDTLAAEAAPSLKPGDTGAFTLGSNEFSFVYKSKSTTKQTQLTNSSRIEAVSDDENVKEEENNTYFTPVIPLPDKIEVKTGEEDEDVLYSHRAKLFRFRNSEWRERGLGDVKILKHKKSDKLRVVMRRETIHKICLNHILSPDIEYKVKDSKSWQFIANDFSEGQIELDNFCLRFKTEEIARDFKEAVDDALGGVGPKTNVAGNADQADATSSSSKAIMEERKNISSLQLPGNFYDYKTQPDCAGCRGCSNQEYEFPEPKDTYFGQTDDNPLPLVAPLKVNLAATNDLSKDIIKPAQTNTFSFASHGNEDNGFKFATGTNTNSVQSAGLFFDNSNFKSAFGADNDKMEATKINRSFGKTNLFGGNAIKISSAEPSTPSFSFNNSGVFGLNATDDKPTFSFKMATTPNSKQDKSKPLFGGVATFSASSAMKSPITNIFGANTNDNDSSKEKEDSTSASEPFQSSPAIGLSFAALAQSSSNGPSTFGQNAGGFFGLSNRDTFSNLLRSTSNGNDQNSSANDDDNENSVDDANYDPQHDPIIELPDEIRVITGEENEVKLFGESAKLYRFDSNNKEWKERGVGEFKILYHPANDSYRLLMRREKIHKLVLNMALTAELQINPMKQSDKAFVWVAKNFGEEQENGELESLSVRFKNAELASKFNSRVKDCIEKLRNRDIQN